MASQKKNSAMVADEQSKLHLQEIATPTPGSKQVLVEVSHVAQNPTDIQSLDSGAFGAGAVFGCDFVGKVVELGSKVRNIQQSDIIAGLIWGGEIKGLGGLSRYTLADADICFKVPKGASNEAASTIPLASTTAWLAFFSSQCLGIQRSQPETLLVWGGSSSVGQYAIQLAKQQGFAVVTTCSPKNFDLVKGLGADHVFDYNSAEVVPQIKEAAPKLRYIFDTIGSSSSSKLAAQAVADRGKLCTVRPGKANTEDVPSNVEVSDVLVWTAFLKEHSYGKFHWPPSEEDHQLGSELFKKIPEWLQSRQLKTNATLSMKGPQDIEKGFEMYREGKISAQKIVYEMEW